MEKYFLSNVSALNIRKAETRRQKLMASRVKAEQAGLVNKRYGVTAE